MYTLINVYRGIFFMCKLINVVEENFLYVR